MKSRGNGSIRTLAPSSTAAAQEGKRCGSESVLQSALESLVPASMMLWTSELNDLLNQCVFECGYEFTDACSLLQSRARTLRLIPEDGSALTADSCQVQWMTINPMDEDDHDAEESGSDRSSACYQQVLEDMEFLREAASTASSSGSEPSSSHRECMGNPLPSPANDDRERSVPASPSTPAQPVATAAVSAVPRTNLSAYGLHECAPLLELSISDAELDLLINSLPAPSPEDGDNNSNEADPKLGAADARSAGRRAGAAGSSSEMQWVLSFLTDPDDAARHDAEAKSLLENVEKHDDDNYQYFLQELNHANLMLLTGKDTAASSDQDGGLQVSKQEDASLAGSKTSLNSDPAQAFARLRMRAHDDQEECRQADALTSTDDPIGDDDDDDDAEDRSDDDDWEIVRRSMKTQATHQVSSTVRVTSITSNSVHEARTNDSWIPGDDLPPPAPLTGSSSSSISSSSYIARPSHAMKNQRVALSQEIGDLLKTHGEFQFPKHMFPHHNDAD